MEQGCHGYLGCWEHPNASWRVWVGLGDIPLVPVAAAATAAARLEQQERRMEELVWQTAPYRDLPSDSGGLGTAWRRSPGGPKGIAPFPKPHFTPRVWPQTSPQSPHTPPLGLPAPSVCSFSSAAMSQRAGICKGDSCAEQ